MTDICHEFAACPGPGVGLFDHGYYHKYGHHDDGKDERCQQAGVGKKYLTDESIVDIVIDADSVCCAFEGAISLRRKLCFVPKSRSELSNSSHCYQDVNQLVNGSVYKKCPKIWKYGPGDIIFVHSSYNISYQERLREMAR